MTDSHLVSVIMSTYNANPEHLRQAISSILKQTYQNFELIIVNDGSTTINPEEIIKSFSDDRIIYIHMEENQGLTKCLNVALDHCRGDFIARMDDDDIALPTRLEKQVEFLRDNPEANIVGSYVEYFGEKTGIHVVKMDNDREKQQIRLLFSNTAIPHPTAMIRRDFLIRYNIRYNEKYKKAQDYALWVDCVKYSKIDCLPEVLLKYRVHKKQISSKGRSEQTFYNEMIKLDQLKALGVPMDKNQKETHLAFCRMAPDLRIKDTENWIRYLKRFNREHDLFDHAKFVDVINSHWLFTCYNNIIDHRNYKFVWPLLKTVRPKNIKSFISNYFRRNAN